MNAEHQQVLVGAMAEVKAQAFFLAQTLDEIQVGFVVLGAVFAFGMRLRTLLKVESVGEDAVLLEDLGDDIRYALVLEDPLLGAVLQVRQARDQCQLIASQALGGLALAGTMDMAMQANVLGPER